MSKLHRILEFKIGLLLIGLSIMHATQIIILLYQYNAHPVIWITCLFNLSLIGFCLSAVGINLIKGAIKRSNR